MGQSASASSIMHHITSYGGRNDLRPPFKQAILESPGFIPQPDEGVDDSTYKQFLNLTGAKDLESLQTESMDSKMLMEANAIMTYNSSYGIFKFGPTVDGSYVPDLPGLLLKEGKFHERIPMVLGYTSNNGVALTPPLIRSNSALRDHVKELFPDVPKSVLEWVDDHYPIGEKETERERIRHVADFLDVSSFRSLSWNLKH
jgi:carboxylesterase type B